MTKPTAIPIRILEYFPVFFLILALEFLSQFRKKKDCGKSNKNDVRKIVFEVQPNSRIQIAKAADFAPFFNFLRYMGYSSK